MARLSIFFMYSPNIFGQNFFVRKLVKRNFIPVLFSRYFFHYVNDRYTMRYSLSFPLKKSSLNLVKLISSQILKFQNERY